MKATSDFKNKRRSVQSTQKQSLLIPLKGILLTKFIVTQPYRKFTTLWNQEIHYILKANHCKIS